MGRFRVEHGVLAIGVVQDFVETVEHAVHVEQSAAFGFDGLFEAAGGASGVSAETFGAALLRAGLFRAGRFFDVSSVVPMVQRVAVAIHRVVDDSVDKAVAESSRL